MRYIAIAVLALLITIPTFFIHWLVGWCCFLGLYYLGLRFFNPRVRRNE